jgi:uncharacterized protein
MSSLAVPGVPFSLSPTAGEWTVDDTGVSVTALPRSDIFVDPTGGAVPNAETLMNATALRGVPPTGDFRLSSRVTVEFGSTFDAGALLVWVDETHWAKLCFEYSPAGDPMVVSVVCRGVSDDANSFTVDGRSVWLRVSRVDQAVAFHASVDGRRWEMVRYFALDGATDSASVGFEAQSPTGNGCAVRSDEIDFAVGAPNGLRDGS